MVVCKIKIEVTPSDWCQVFWFCVLVGLFGCCLLGFFCFVVLGFFVAGGFMFVSS